jgi:hypothetical protein
MSLSVFTARSTPCDPLYGLELRGALIRDSGAFSSFLLTRAVRGTIASSTASVACGVPGMDASTRERGCSTGMRLKSSGNDGVANVHGPSRLALLNQRPATRK